MPIAFEQPSRDQGRKLARAHARLLCSSRPSAGTSRTRSATRSRTRPVASTSPISFAGITSGRQRGPRPRPPRSPSRRPPHERQARLALGGALARRHRALAAQQRRMKAALRAADTAAARRPRLEHGIKLKACLARSRAARSLPVRPREHKLQYPESAAAAGSSEATPSPGARNGLRTECALEDRERSAAITAARGSLSASAPSASSAAAS